MINLCGASDPREEHLASPMMIYLETDPGVFQVNLERRDPIAIRNASAHKFFFTYACNIGEPDCRVPTAGLDLASRRARRCCSTNGIRALVPRSPPAFTTVGTWRNKGNDIEVGGTTYYWSKHVNFAEGARGCASRRTTD